MPSFDNMYKQNITEINIGFRYLMPKSRNMSVVYNFHFIYLKMIRLCVLESTWGRLALPITIDPVQLFRELFSVCCITMRQQSDR